LDTIVRVSAHGPLLSLTLGRESLPTPNGVKCKLYMFGNHLMHGILPS